MINNFYKNFITIIFSCFTITSLTMEQTIVLSHNSTLAPDAQYMMHSMIAHYSQVKQKTITSSIASLPRDRDSGKTLLHHAAKQTNLTLLTSYISRYYADIDVQDNNGDSPLHSAAEHNNQKWTDLLLAKKANPNIQNRNGITPLIQAIINHSTECAVLLIENGAPQKPLMITQEKNYNPEDYISNFFSKSPKRTNITVSYYPENLLLDIMSRSPRNEKIVASEIDCPEELLLDSMKELPINQKIEEDYKFLAPIHSALLCARLAPLYEQQQTKLYQSLLLTKFILQHYLDESNDVLIKNIIHLLIHDMDKPL